jgi:hypothetical protein
MTETKKSLVERLFAEHGGALKAFLYRRVRRHPEAANSRRRFMYGCSEFRI